MPQESERELDRSSADAAPSAPTLTIAVALTSAMTALTAAVVGYETGQTLIPVPIRGVLVSASAVCWIACFVLRAEYRTGKQLQEVRAELAFLRESIDVRLKKAGYAEGFADGARRLPTQPEASLRAIN
jgi:hypothetical protein